MSKFQELMDKKVRLMREINDEIYQLQKNCQHAEPSGWLHSRDAQPFLGDRGNDARMCKECGIVIEIRNCMCDPVGLYIGSTKVAEGVTGVKSNAVQVPQLSESNCGGKEASQGNQSSAG